jgi:hypothetical protein
MNKIKLAFIAIAILAGVGGAFATKPCFECGYSQQYIWTGSYYQPVGDYGEEFDCYVTGGICTFYKPDPMGQPNVYAPCHEGAYVPL